MNDFEVEVCLPVGCDHVGGDFNGSAMEFE